MLTSCFPFFVAVFSKRNRKQGVLTIYKNHPVGNFRHKHLTIKCDVAEEGVAVKYIYFLITGG